MTTDTNSDAATGTATNASASDTREPGDRAARWEDYVDILYAPSRVFARRAADGFWLPMLVVTVVGAAIFFASFDAMAPVMDAEFARSSAAAIRRGATPEMMAKGRAIGEKLVKVMAVIAPPVLMFLTGLLLWLAGRLVGARQTLNAAITVAAFASVPRILAAVLGAAQAVMMDPSALTSRYSVGFSPARLLDVTTDSPLLVALAGRLDLVTIWSTILLAIGLAVTGRISRGRAAVAALLVFVASSLPEVLGALRQ